MITQDLGIATAYGYAKSKGYTGTEAEFAELMASYASTAQTAIEAADRAVEANTAAQSAKTDAAASKTAAQTAAQTATTKASEASQSASTATTKASEASQSASTASSAATSAGTSAQTATTAATTATTKASEAAESEAAALSAKTDAESARDAAAQSASEAAESASTLTIDATLTQSGQAADASETGNKITSLKEDLKSALSDVRSNNSADTKLFEQTGICVNLFNPKTIIENTAVKETDGTLYGATGYNTSDFIPVRAGKKYSFFRLNNSSVSSAAAGRCVAYDKNGNFKSSIGAINLGNKTRTIPNDGTAYVRIQFDTSYYPNANALMFIEVEDETVPSVFYPYGETDFRVADCASKSVLDNVVAVFDVVYNNLTGTIIDGTFIQGDGSFDTSLSSYHLLKVSVTSGNDYYITAQAYSGKAYYVFHDSSENIVGTFETAPTTSTITNYKVTAPTDAAYIYVVSSVSANVQAVKTFDHYEIPTGSKVWANKKWVVVGDSLTEVNAYTSKHYYDYISDETGITVAKEARGGTGYVRGYGDSHAFYQRISSVPTDADVVTIFGSGNDMNIEAMSKFDGKTWEQALGTYTDDTTDTICGCINVTIDNYYTIMPVIPIGIIAPTPWKSYPTTKLTGNRFDDYVSSMKQICAYRGVPFLDLYHESNLRPEDATNRGYCFDEGGVHPNELGHKILAPKIFEFVKTLLQY